MSQPPPPVGAPPPKKTNWVLIGCGGCLGLIILGAIAGVAIFFGVLKVIKSSDAYQTALNGAVNSPLVQEELGTPITAGMMPQGSVNTTNDTGNADLTIPISGPKAEASIHYRATRANSVWTVSEHKVTVKGSGKEIDLQH